jgi:hypothetical protein
VPTIAKQNPRFGPGDFDRWHRGQLWAPDRGKCAGRSMGHKLANVVLELIIESIGAATMASSRSAIAIAIGRTAVRIASVSGLPLVRAMLTRMVFLLRVFASHLELLFFRLTFRHTLAGPEAGWGHGTITG